MNTSQWEDKIISYLDGTMTPTEKEMFELALAKDQNLQKLLEEYKAIYVLMDNPEKEQPSASLDIRFHTFLEEEQEKTTATKQTKTTNLKTRTRFITWMKQGVAAAAIFACLITGYNLHLKNQYIKDDLANMHSQMDLILNENSPTDRIKMIRVNNNPGDEDMDDAMFTTLFGVLDNDESSNVRLATVETLSTYMNIDKVKIGLINRISDETDGMVKLAIIQALGQEQNNTIKETLEEIVNDGSHEKFVVDGAHMQLIKYEKEEY